MINSYTLQTMFKKNAEMWHFMQREISKVKKQRDELSDAFDPENPVNFKEELENRKQIQFWDQLEEAIPYKYAMQEIIEYLSQNNQKIIISTEAEARLMISIYGDPFQNDDFLKKNQIIHEESLKNLPEDGEELLKKFLDVYFKVDQAEIRKMYNALKL